MATKFCLLLQEQEAVPLDKVDPRANKSKSSMLPVATVTLVESTGPGTQLVFFYCFLEGVLIPLALDSPLS